MQPHPCLRTKIFSGLKRLTALATALLFVSMTSASLFAQQEPYGPGPQQQYSAPQQPYPYSNQYDPNQQYASPSGYGPSGYNQPQPGYDQQSQGLGPDQLQQLVAPIALNPDPLVALMLAASTYPNQVAAADQWRQSQGNIAPDQVVYGADQQNWDPSVKALTAFPQVLAQMDRNIQWISALGNAYYNQPQDVLQAIQFMRQRARSAGNLQSTPEEDVSYDQGNIQLAPANPQVIYVPAYNPWTVYGQPVSPYPGFSLLGALGGFFNSSLGSSAIQYGLGIVMSAFSHSPWGLLSWGLNWLTNNLLFHNSDYYSRSPYVSDWGLRYGGPRAYLAPHRSYAAYNRGYGSGRGYGQNFREQNRYNGNMSRENYNRNDQNRYQNSGYRNSLYRRQQSPFANHANYAYSRNTAYSRNAMSAGRSQSNLRQAYGSGSGFYGRSQSTFANRSGYNSYRAPSSGIARNSFDQRSSFNQRSSSFDRGNASSGSYKSSHSGGFHPFGGSHNSGSFGHQKSYSYKAPKYKAPKGFGGGHHSFGGGHSSSHGGGHSHGGGGHHHL